MPGEYVNYRHFAQILWCLSMCIYRDFMVLRVCQFTEILLGFYGAPSMSIYRDFTMP